VKVLSSEVYEKIEDVLAYPVRINMRSNPLTVPTWETVSSLVYKMIEENIGAVIVVKENQPLGIITEKDILERVVKPGKNLHATKARDIMSEPVIAVMEDSSIKDALELMHEHDIRRLVIKKDETIVGLISERRLLEIVSARSGIHLLA
jgi:CBS domain-containing protein